MLSDLEFENGLRKLSLSDSRGEFKAAAADTAGRPHNFVVAFGTGDVFITRIVYLCSEFVCPNRDPP